MIENTQNSFEGYIGLFTVYIISINYTTFMGQILIFGPNWIQITIVPQLFSTAIVEYERLLTIVLKNNFLNSY